MSKFADELTLTIIGGRGGDGAVHFARFKYKPRGGPDGGDGGDGGSVFLVGDQTLEGLEHLSESGIYRAENGQDGGPSKKSGRRGENLLLKVPLGTTAYDYATKMKICLIQEDKQEVLVAPGGKGGRGNARFSTPKTRTPRFAETGTEGTKKTLNLVYRAYAPIAFAENIDHDLTLTTALHSGQLAKPYRFYERPRILRLTLGFQEFRVVLLPINIDRGKPKIHFLKHIYFAKSLVLNALFAEESMLADVVWPGLITAVQQEEHQNLRHIFILAREDPGLPYEVELEGNAQAKIEVKVLCPSEQIDSPEKLLGWAEENLLPELSKKGVSSSLGG